MEGDRRNLSKTPARKRSSAGRPEVTSHAAIERAAFRLFAERGFDGTTLQAIAEAVGVGRRTLFRYYESKNDIPWGQFDQTLQRFRALLEEAPPQLPLAEAVHRAVIEFNRFDADAQPSHWDRMALILGTPALQAHSVLRYTQWRTVIAEFVSTRRGMQPDDLLPQVAGQVSLALALSAYNHWLSEPGRDLLQLLDEAMGELRRYLAGD